MHRKENIDPQRLGTDGVGVEGGSVGGKQLCYKLFWVSNKEGNGSVSTLFAGWQVYLIWFAFLTGLLSWHWQLARAFAPFHLSMTGLSDDGKNFWDELRLLIAKTNSSSETTFLLGNCNGHVSQLSARYALVHGGHYWGARNAEGERVLEFVVSCDLFIDSTCLTIKPPDHILFGWRKYSDHLYVYTKT